MDPSKVVEEIVIRSLGEKELLELSSRMLLSLGLVEMKTIQDFFERLKRNPTDAELETIAQTWSEHCKHKVFNSKIEFEEDGKKQSIEGLFKTFISGATKEIAQKKKGFLVSVFHDNAGMISFDKKFAVAAKVETHNHPSALEPYGGANTGVGGVIRDVLGAGLGAKPIAVTDVFCFADPKTPQTEVPLGVMHPKRIFKGVRKGVADYGNQMGIPTVNGSIFFDKRFVANPLVFCGCIGIIPKTKVKKSARPGDLIVVCGARTGKDGIHGATFSSVALDESSPPTAVQIGNAIEERKLMDFILQSTDQKLFSNITDCGAGGFSSAIGEMAQGLGARVELKNAPLKYKGLLPWQIWISESQERMVLAVPKKNLPKLMEIAQIEEVEIAVLGEFNSSGKLEVFFEGQNVLSLDLKFLHEGLVNQKRTAKYTSKLFEEPKIQLQEDFGKTLHSLLAMPNIASKETTVRRYDHEVQGGSVIKPFVGVKNDGPSDAAVVRPLLDKKEGVVIANGINPSYGDISPYWMAASVIDEAIRNAICVGVDFEKLALLDNFSWGNPQDAQILGQLVKACQACFDFSTAFGTPFISGKDSLYNEFHSGKVHVSIPGTLLISAVGIMDDCFKRVSMDLKEAANPIYVVGETFAELGGSQFFAMNGFVGNSVPKVNAKTAKKTFYSLSKVMQVGKENSSRIVRACHDASDGGLGVAFAEMAFAGGLGLEIDLSKVVLGEKIQRADFVLFSESNSRFVVEVNKKFEKKFEKMLFGVPFARVGQVTQTGRLVVKGLAGNLIVNEGVFSLKESWQKTLKW